MRIFAALVLMASVSTPALAQASYDKLADAVDSAISNNPTLMAERKTRNVADEVLKQAQAQMGPQLNLSGSYGTSNNTIGRQVTTASGSFPEDGVNQRGQVGLEARQSLWSGGSLTAQRDQARAGVDESQARLLDVEQKTVLSVVTAFVDVRRSERELEIRETNVASLREQGETARNVNTNTTLRDNTAADIALRRRGQDLVNELGYAELDTREKGFRATARTAADKAKINTATLFRILDISPSWECYANETFRTTRADPDGR